MSSGSGGGFGRSSSAGSPAISAVQAIAPAASLATFVQRIRVRLPIYGFEPRTRARRPPAAIVVRRLAIAVNKQYELVLMLDPEVPDERRDEIAAQTRQRIEAGGTLKHDASWGMRKLAYEIRQRTEADYRLFRFEGQSGVLDELNHNLQIADGVLRFRIFKVDPDSPVIVPPPAMGTSRRAHPRSAPRRGSGRGSRRGPERARGSRRSSARGPKRARGSGRGSRRGAQRGARSRRRRHGGRRAGSRGRSGGARGAASP